MSDDYVAVTPWLSLEEASAAFEVSLADHGLKLAALNENDYVRDLAKAASGATQYRFRVKRTLFPSMADDAGQEVGGDNQVG